MSYCNKFKIEPSVARCLACEHCLPPGERVGGRMCPHEELQKGEMVFDKERQRKLADLLDGFKTQIPPHLLEQDSSIPVDYILKPESIIPRPSEV